MDTQRKEGRLPKRSEGDPRYQWDLTPVFASDDKWEEAFQEVKERIPELNRYQGRLTESAETLASALKLKDEISEKVEKIYVYAHLKKDEDTTNAKYVALENRAISLYVEAKSAMSYFSPELIQADEKVIRSYLESHEPLKMYEHYLNELLRQKEHTLSAREEAILAQASEMAQAPAEIFSMINDADMKFPEITTEDGHKQELTQARYIRFMESRSRRVRQDAFKAMYSTYGKQKHTLAATLNANVKKDIFYARVRNYPSALEASLDKDRIPTSVYTSLIEAIHEALPVFYRYLALRKKVLKLDELHMYDLYVPLVEDKESHYPYEEAKKLVRDSLKPMGDEYLAVVDEIFGNRWIDVYENEGKRSGAYSSGTYGTPPYILLNYQGSLNDVFTLTHELGHSVHSYFSRAHQPYIYADYTIFVAEVASTLNEALLTHHLLNITEDPTKRIVILNHYLDSFRGTVFRQTMFAEFEKMIHEAVEKGEALTADKLCTMYYDLNKTYFGPDMVVDEDIAMEWARIPHFYYNFYVYKYATGFSAATALSRQILNEGQAAVQRYIAFLKSGGSDYPLELLKKAGVDMTSPEPVRKALQVFEETLTELERLL